jgi:hypothetical protein
VTALATTFRTDVAAVAQAALIASGNVQASGFQIVPGMLSGTMADNDRGCVWVSRVEADSGAQDLEWLSLHLRVFKRFYERRGGDYTPFDPSVLEGIAETLQTCFNNVETAQGVWYLQFQYVDFLLDQQAVEVVYLGRNANLYRTTS